MQNWFEGMQSLVILVLLANAGVGAGVWYWGNRIAGLLDKQNRILRGDYS